MEIESITRLTIQGLLLCLYISLPAVLTATAVGLLASFVQAITSVQDASISYGLKLLAVTLALVLSAPWIASSVLGYANSLMSTALSS